MRRRLTLILLALSVAFGQQALAPPSITFRAQTRLVLLSFHVTRGRNFVPDLKASDLVLLQDGKPREFTIFDSPVTKGRMPLELVLLFDTNPKIDYFWDPADVFRFIPQWNDGMSRSIFEKGTADLRMSVYRCAGQQLFRLSPATTDSRQFSSALRRLMTPEIPVAGPDSVEVPLALPAKRDAVDPGPFTNDYVTSPFVLAAARGWPMEAAIGVLNDVSAAADKVARILVMFSEGIGATTTIPEDTGNQALDLGIPIYPVVTNYQNHIHSGYPRNLFRMRQFAALGKMTGGRPIEYPSVDAATLRKVLESVRDAGWSQYVVGFVPSSSDGPAKEHKLEVKMAVKANRVVEGGLRRAIY